MPNGGIESQNAEQPEMVLLMITKPQVYGFRRWMAVSSSCYVETDAFPGFILPVPEILANSNMTAVNEAFKRWTRCHAGDPSAGQSAKRVTTKP